MPTTYYDTKYNDLIMPTAFINYDYADIPKFTFTLGNITDGTIGGTIKVRTNTEYDRFVDVARAAMFDEFDPFTADVLAEQEIKESDFVDLIMGK